MNARATKIVGRGYDTGSQDTLPEPEATIARERQAAVIARGWRYMDFKPPRKSMAGIQRERLNARFWVYSSFGGIWDHAYRLVHRDGRVLWVGEPYQLNGTALEDIAKLREQGYDVEIRSDWAIHYPGCTVAVLVSEGEGG